MKKRLVFIALIVILLITSVAAELSRTSDWFGSRPFYKPGDKISLAENSFLVKNTGTDQNGKYVILESNNERNKIYENQILKMGDIEIYVETIVDDGGNKFDSAVIFLALRRNERPQGIYKGENTYEIRKLGEIKLNTGNHIIIKDIKKDYALISIDGIDYTFLFKERKLIGRISILLDNILYNQRAETGTVILKILIEKSEEIKETPKPTIVKKVPKEPEIEIVREELEEIIVEEPEEQLNLDTIILDFLKKIWYKVF